jgi:hypothetical protein
MRANKYPMTNRFANKSSQIKLIVFCCAFISALLPFSIFAQNLIYTAPGTGTWMAPAGVTSITVECWGGGGAGGGATGYPAGGGGGAGGSYVKNSSVSVVASQIYNYSVGAGGVGSTMTGLAGGDSWFGNASTGLAKGGRGGIYANANGMTAAGGTALTTGNIGPISFYGGAGSTGAALGFSSGGGGGSAGSGSTGNPGVGTTGGVAQNGGGAGGNGTTLNANGINAPGIGGGGGGAHATTAADKSGGNGGDGKLALTYTCPVYALTGITVTPVCTGNSSLVTITGTSTSLPTGIYSLTYNISGANAITSVTIPLTITTAGVGSFTTSVFNEIGTSTITITQLVSSTCSSALSANNSAAVIVGTYTNPIVEFTQGIRDTVANIPVCGLVGGGGQNDMDIESGYPVGASIQWQYSTDLGTTWINAPGPTAVNTQYVLNPVYTSFESIAGVYYFRVVITSGYCISTSNSIVLTVTGVSNLTPGTIGSDQVFCASGDPAILTQINNPTGASGTYTYQWIVSTDSINYNIISGATSQTYNPGIISQTNYYQRITISNGCSAKTNAVRMLIVSGVTENPGSIMGYSTICANSTQLQYSVNAVSGADAYTWNLPTGWQITSGNGTNSIIIQSGNINQTGNISVAASNYCGLSSSSVLPVSLTNGSTSAILSGSRSICSGNSANLQLSVEGGAAPFEIVYSDGNNNFTVPNYISGSNITVIPTVNTSYNLVSVKSVGGCYGSGNQGNPSVSMMSAGTWIGEISRDWNDPANWCGGVPDSLKNATILNGNPYLPIVNGTAFVKNIILGTGTELLTIEGNIKIYGSLSSSGGLNAVAGSVELCNPSIAQEISGSMFTLKSIKNLRLSNNNGISLSGLGDTLKISGVLDFGKSNVVFTTNGNLTMVSNAASTATLADFTSNGIYYGNRILGNVTVERYIANHPKSWRFVSVPTSGQSVKNAWMEGNLPMSNLNNPGYGTIITSNLSGATSSLGFDIYTPSGSSLKTYNNINSSWESVASSFNQIANNKGYMLFVRGDRSVTVFNQAPTATTLRTTGQLYTPIDNPPSAITVQADKFESIGNPYASAIDFSKIEKTGGIQDVFYTWDPDLTSTQYSAYGLGGYQTIVRDRDGYIAIPGGGSYINGNFNIKSGQAFFVSARGSEGRVSFSESCKTIDNEQMYRFRSVSTTPSVRLNYAVISGGNPILLDGVLSQFDSSFSTTVDSKDVLKIGNSTSENIGIMRELKRLTLERRPFSSDPDTIIYNLGLTKRMNYQFELIVENFDASRYALVFYDKYLNSATPINADGSSFVSFSVNTDAGSYAADRFYLVVNPLVQTPLLPFEIAVTGIRNTAEINWNQLHSANASQFIVEKSTNGKLFYQQSVIPVTHKAEKYSVTDNRPNDEDVYYRVIKKSVNGQMITSNVIHLRGEDLSSSINISPNPVVNKEINIHFKNRQQGKYVISVFSNEGKLISQQEILLQSNTESKKIVLPTSVSKGNYKVMIKEPGLNVIYINVSVI